MVMILAGGLQWCCMGCCRECYRGVSAVSTPAARDTVIVSIIMTIINVTIITMIMTIMTVILMTSRSTTRKESPVLDTATMRSWLARRRWLKAATVLRALQRLARFSANTGNTDKKKAQVET